MLTLWLKEIFCAFSGLEQVPPSLLIGIICLIYKGRGKDLLSFNSYRGITLTPVLRKIFKLTLLNQLLPVLKGNVVIHWSLKLPIRSIFHVRTPSSPILSNLRYCRVCYLSLYDLEKAFDSIEHCILLQSLFEAGVNGKAWRLFRTCLILRASVRILSFVREWIHP